MEIKLEVMNMCEQYVVPEEVLNSDKLYQYFLEAVSQFKKVAYCDLYKFDTKQLSALLKMNDEAFNVRSVFESPHFFYGEFIVMRKMAETLVIRRLVDALSDD
jgi:hypothetical protein